MESLEGAGSERDRCQLLRGKEVGDKLCLIEGFCEDSYVPKGIRGHKACILQTLKKQREPFHSRQVYISSILRHSNYIILKCYSHYKWTGIAIISAQSDV